MAADIPTKEPSVIHAGMTLKFDRAFPDFPSDVWTLTYALRNATAAPIDITATANNTDHRVNETIATTQTWIPGTYQMLGHVTDGTEKHQVFCARVEVKLDPSLELNYDHRTFAETMVDLIKLRLSGAASDDVISYSINGRSFTVKSDADLQTAYDYWQGRVNEERRRGTNRKILGRFRKGR